VREDELPCGLSGRRAIGGFSCQRERKRLFLEKAVIPVVVVVVVVVVVNSETSLP
jgi:hypothetical protein